MTAGVAVLPLSFSQRSKHFLLLKNKKVRSSLLSLSPSFSTFSLYRSSLLSLYIDFFNPQHSIPLLIVLTPDRA